jgi:DNA-binding transcriptional MerR regulator
VYDDDEYRLAVAQRFALVRAGLVTADVLAETLGVREERLRQWASRGHIGRHGKDERGRTLYDPDEVRARALAVGLLRSA